MSTKRRMIRLAVGKVLDNNAVLVSPTLCDEIADAVLLALDEAEKNDRIAERARKDKAPKVPPEIMRFHDIAGFFPYKENYQEIIDGITGKTDDELRETRRAWLAKGNNPRSIIWLKWLNKSPQKVVVS